MLALLLPLLTHLFLTSLSVSLSYFILAVPMCLCLVKHSCVSSSFSIHTECYLFFHKAK